MFFITLQIPEGTNQQSTNMFNVDDPQKHRVGALRACAGVSSDLKCSIVYRVAWRKGQLKWNLAQNCNPKGNGQPTTCTPWARSTVNAENKLDAAVTGMMMFYEAWRGLWLTVGWWNAANAMTVLIDYQIYTGRRLYEFAIDNTFELNKGLNEFGG